jgi:hypothetical protein
MLGSAEKPWSGSVSPFEETNRENCHGSQVRIDHDRGRAVSNPTGSSSERILTQILNVGIEVFSVVTSFLTCGTLHIYSELPGGENVGRTSFSQAIASIFDNHDVADVLAADATSPSTAGSSRRSAGANPTSPG